MAAWFEATTAEIPFRPCLGELERRLFEWAPASAVRLHRAALDKPTVDAATGMVTTDAARRAVGFGFCDTVYLTGSMLFASLLRYRALGQMLAMGQALGHKHPEWAASRNLRLSILCTPVHGAASR